LANEGGEDALPAHKERSRGDKESEAHAPQVPRDAGCSGDASGNDHTDVANGGNQENEGEEEVHARGDAVFWNDQATSHLIAIGSTRDA
jgi:hypothetical protein